eukprot:13206-Eustigmatos_ZCMA.PRE.1
MSVSARVSARLLCMCYVLHRRELRARKLIIANNEAADVAFVLPTQSAHGWKLFVRHCRAIAIAFDER